MVKSDKIIERLVQGHQAFTPVYATERISIVWTALALLVAGLVSYSLADFRDGFLLQIINYPRFGLEIITGTLLIVFLSFKAIGLGIPGRRMGLVNAALLVLVVFGALLISLSVFYQPAAPASMSGKRSFCFTEGLAIGLILLCSMLHIVRRRAPFNRFQVGVFSGAAACCVTFLIMHVACMYVPSHVVTHHISPIFIMAAVGGLIGPLLIRKV